MIKKDSHNEERYDTEKVTDGSSRNIPVKVLVHILATT